MLYDPKWNGPSLQSFIAWLETKDPNERYDFLDCNGTCCMGQYMKAMGIKWRSGRHFAAGGSQKYFEVCGQVLGEYSLAVLNRHPQTFGGVLDRIRAFELS